MEINEEPKEALRKLMANAMMIAENDREKDIIMRICAFMWANNPYMLAWSMYYKIVGKLAQGNFYERIGNEMNASLKAALKEPANTEMLVKDIPSNNKTI